MNLKVLQEKYLRHPRLLQVADRFSFVSSAEIPETPQKIFLKNLQGSSAEFITAAIFFHEQFASVNHLVILNDAEEAAYFHNTLENITGALDVFYFPSSFKNKKNYRLLNSSHVMLRTEALTKIASGGNKKILITYPEAIFEKVILPKTLQQNIISIKQADTIDVNGILEAFVNFGFERTDFVYEPGQFAVRGGILDIYSYGNEHPFRIELFGNEVDSIRIFNPETQLSERRLLQINIIPNVDTITNQNDEDGDKISIFDI